ncbi:MAG: hypothetical protein ABI333_06815 [bacterium]
MTARIETLALATLVTMLVLTTSSETAEARRGARSYKFDGFKLGDSYSKLFQRAPYNQPCDNDPVDNRKRRAMVYGALPCRRRVFPEQTTVLIYLQMNAPGTSPYAQPIEALAFLHGQYFRKRSNFPVHPGDKLGKARQRFGRPLGTMILPNRRGPSLTAHRFRGDIHILTEGALVRGVVVGRMPTDPSNEQWRGLMQMVRRYTPLSGLPPARPAGLTGVCARLWKRAVACRNNSRVARKMAGRPSKFLSKCTRKLGKPGDRGILTCMSRSKTCAAFDGCLPR